MNKIDFLIILISILILIFIGILKENKIEIREKIMSFNIVIRWSIYYFIIFSIIIFGVYGIGYSAASFIYGGF
jgi:hypothetical protein